MDDAPLSENFLKSTGFGTTTAAPPPPPPPALPQKPSNLSNFYSMSQPNLPQHLPGTFQGTNPYAKGMETPQGGLVPGHMPLSASLDTTPKEVPFPSSSRLDKLPFVRTERDQVQDWRAVGIGPETSRRTPGRVAQSPPNQGRMGYLEKMTGAAGLVPLNVLTPGIFAVVMAGALYKYKGAVLAVVPIVLFALYYYYYYHYSSEKAVGNAMGNPSRDSPDVRDSNFPQRYQPFRASQGEQLPYKRVPDNMESTEMRMARQGTDMNDLEGPRDGFRYKRGPTPANQRRLQTSDLMRDPSLYNMDANEFGEYMARLEGESPDRFYQAHPYHPFGPHWAHRNQVDDAETVHGISTQPGQMNRKYKYVDPRMQQAGAKTSHLKDPPPGSVPPLDKVHPWLEKQAGVPIGEAFNMDKYDQQATTTTPQQMAAALTSGGKIDENDAQDFINQRMRETKMLVPENKAPKNPDDIPLELQPVPTTRKGLAELEKRKQEQAAKRQQVVQAYENSKEAPQLQTAAPVQTPAMYGDYDEQPMDDLAAAFSTKKQPSESMINEAMSDVRR